MKSETGHAKNIANFQDLISFCQGYGASYNPTKESLKIPQLLALYQLAQDKLNATKTQKKLSIPQQMSVKIHLLT